MVTDRKEGRAVDFEQNKPYIAQEFGNELQKNVVNAERQRAKIDIKPMPKDLFPAPAPAAATAPAPRPRGLRRRNRDSAGITSRAVPSVDDQLARRR